MTETQEKSSSKKSDPEKEAQEENLDDAQKESLAAYNERQKQLKDIGAI
jgi:hypothetical protein